ncbi:MAG: MotA/TolQ/ExbB proton channel family protein [Gallionella sp.]
MNMSAIEHVANSSSGIIYFMAVLLLVALTIAIERSIHLRKVIKQGNQIMTQLESQERIEEKMLEHLGESYALLPHVSVMMVAIKHDLAHDFDRISDKLDEAVMRQAPSVDRFLWILDTIVTMAPLLGLLGTILGMFNAFQVLGDAGSAPTKVTGGVAEALLATAFGLVIAIIGLFFFNALNNRVRVIIHQLETLKVMLLNRMYLHYQDTAEATPIRVVAGLKMGVA